MNQIAQQSGDSGMLDGMSEVECCMFGRTKKPSCRRAFTPACMEGIGSDYYLSAAVMIAIE